MEAALVNLVIYRPAPACARHARKKFYVCLILWVIGLAAAFSLTLSEQALGVDNPFTPIGDNPTIPASIKGTVYFDANHNKQLDPNEFAISGGSIELFSGSNLIATTTVGNDGQYFFNDLDAGKYSIYNTIDGTWWADPGYIYGINQITTPSSATGDGMSIDNVELKAGDQGYMFMFGAQYYPIQLLTKRMLLASADGGGPFIIAVPEPGTAIFLGFTAIAFVIIAARRRGKK
jgi:hypothetical protein